MLGGMRSLMKSHPRSNHADSVSRKDLTLGQKESFVRGECVSVGHTRHEVYGLSDGVGVARRPLFGMIQVVLEEDRHHAGRLLVLARSRLVVNVLEKPRPEPNENQIPT